MVSASFCSESGPKLGEVEVACILRLSRSEKSNKLLCLLTQGEVCLRCLCLCLCVRFVAIPTTVWCWCCSYLVGSRCSGMVSDGFQTRKREVFPGERACRKSLGECDLD